MKNFNKCVAVNRLPVGQSDGLGNFQRDSVRWSAAPAAVA